MNKYFDLLTAGSDISVENIDNCKYCNEEFALFDLEKNILDKQGFKSPDLCPTCRFRMLYSYLNDKHLYHRKDSLDGTNIISVFSPEYNGEVIEAQKYKDMMVDDYALKFGKDLGEDIFGDFKKLYEAFPKFSRMIYPGLENSLYSSHVGWAKNLYLSFCVFEKCENIYYSFRILGNCTNIFNSVDISDSSEIYESRMIANSHDISLSSNTFESSSLLFCSNMQSCTNCILSSNQINSKFKILNKQYEKEEYNNLKKEITDKLLTTSGLNEIKETYYDFLKENLVEPSLNIQNSEKTSGDNMYYSNNNVNSFKGIGNNNTINTILTGNHEGDKMVDMINSIEAGQSCENCIGSCSFGQYITNLFFCNTVSESNSCYYCIDIQQCEECMFSVGIRNKKYTILNKQYEKEEYFLLKDRLIKYLQSRGEWGDFMGFDIGTFPYNDTSSYDFFKVNKVIHFSGKEEIIDKNCKGVVTILGEGFITDATLDLGGKEKIKIKWRTRDKEVNVPEGVDAITLQGSSSILDIKDDILDKAIICEKSGRPFRIIKDELKFLKKKGFPIPSIHHELRIDKLLSQRPIGELHSSVCDKCNADMLSVFKENNTNKVYCPDCYNNYMFK